MSERPDWLLPWFPELRDGPPWVTEEMVAAEPELAGLVDDLAGPAEAVAYEVARVAEAGAPVVVAGSGTAEHGAAAIAEVLDDALRRRGIRGGAVEARDSLEAALDPRPGGVLLAVSHGGRTRATVAALEAAREAGALTALVTADAAAPAAERADHVLETPVRDRSFCHTVAYVEPILAGAAVAAVLDGGGLEAAAVRRHLEAGLALRPQAERVGGELDGVRTLLAVGGGADLVAARELALKVEEAVRLPATARGLETVLHGHLVAADATTGLVLLLTDPRARERRAERAACVLAAAGRIGLRTTVVADAAAAAGLARDPAAGGVLVVPESDALPGVLSSLLSTALALQLLTLALVSEAGVNPDLIRREETPYREAAELAQAKIR